jgi:hypothetical protein
MTHWKAAAAAALLGAVALAGCKPIATGEQDPFLDRRFKITEVSVFPLEESDRVQLEKMSALEDEEVGISITESDSHFLETLRIETVENRIAIESSRKTGSNIHHFLMPNGNVRISASFSWEANDNASLQGLNPSLGTLVPPFSANTTDYELILRSSGTVSLNFRPVPQHPGAGWSASVADGKTLSPLELGVTTYTVVVTPQNTGAPTKTYTVTIKNYPDASLTKIEAKSPAETSELLAWTSGLDAPAGTYAVNLPWVNSAPGNAVLTIALARADTAMTVSGAISALPGNTATIPLGYGETKQIVIETTNTGGGLTDSHRYELNLSRFNGQIPTLQASGGEVIRVLWNNTNNRWEEIHVFKTSGELLFNQTPNKTGRILVVAGGGGGGAADYPASGGGAGGYAEGNAFPLTQLSYAVTVGAGGLGGPGSKNGSKADGFTGENSVFGPVTVYGGGGGARRAGSGYTGAGAPGGSGGGSTKTPGGAALPGVCSNPALASSVQFFGNAGGNHTGGGDTASAGGGAGGAGFAQSAHRGNQIKAGGPGKQNSISGILTTYAQGGPTSNNVNGPTQNEPANSGNGGMGAWNSAGKPGASGIVIVRFPR